MVEAALGTTDGELRFIVIRVSLSLDCNSGCVHGTDVGPKDVNYLQGILFLSGQSLRWTQVKYVTFRNTVTCKIGVYPAISAST